MFGELEQLNCYLFNMMTEEFEDLSEKFINSKGRQVVELADEYVIKRDILKYLETVDLDINVVETLLSTESPLQAVYDAYVNSDASYRQLSYIKSAIMHVSTDIESNTKTTNIDDMISEVSVKKSENFKENKSRESQKNERGH